MADAANQPVRMGRRRLPGGTRLEVIAAASLDEASNDVRAAVKRLNLPPGYGARYGGQTKILDETTKNLIMAILLAMIFVYMVLASQFESFLQPIVIMLVLPIAVPFALFTLWLTGRTLNLWSALGMLLLLGIVKKNSILQVDYTNTLRAQGMERHAALVAANHVRLRPILMTTISIIAGMIPIAFGRGAGAGSRASMAVTISGGSAASRTSRSSVASRWRAWSPTLLGPPAFALTGRLPARGAARRRGLGSPSSGA